MAKEPLVIDNSVLSAFHAAGWITAFDFYSPDRTVAVTEHVWENEFQPHHAYGDQALDFLTVLSTNAITKDRARSGALSVADWTCIELSKEHTRSILVTNDRTLLKTAEEHGVTTVWGTQLARNLYRECPISETEFEEGLGDYTDKVYLPEEVVAELQETEKHG